MYASSQNTYARFLGLKNSPFLAFAFEFLKGELNLGSMFKYLSQWFREHSLGKEISESIAQPEMRLWFHCHKVLPAQAREQYFFRMLCDPTCPAIYHPSRVVAFDDWRYSSIMTWPFIKGTHYWNMTPKDIQDVWLSKIEDVGVDATGT